MDAKDALMMAVSSIHVTFWQVILEVVMRPVQADAFYVYVISSKL